MEQLMIANRIAALVILGIVSVVARADAADDTAVKESKPGPVTRLGWGTTTIGKDGTLYVHVKVWSNGADLVLPIANDPAAVRFIAGKAIDPPQTARREDGLHLTDLPKAAPAKLPIVIALSFGEAGPKVIDNSVKQAADGTLALLATTCEVHATNAKLEKKGDRPYNIGYWTNVKDHVTWDVTVERGGQYSVDLEYSLAANCAGSEISIEFGEQGKAGAQAIPVKLPAGKDFLDFRTINIGTVTLAPGAMTVALRPTKKPGVAVMDLRRIDLKPAK
jgi:hypothetical protein